MAPASSDLAESFGLVTASRAQSPSISGPALSYRSRRRSSAVGRVDVDRCRRALAAMRALVADIDPEPARLGLARGGHHLLAQRFDQRLQQGRRPADPVGQRRAVQLDAVVSEKVRQGTVAKPNKRAPCLIFALSPKSLN
jgi:hypothetical protein